MKKKEGESKNGRSLGGCSKMTPPKLISSFPPLCYTKNTSFNWDFVNCVKKVSTPSCMTSYMIAPLEQGYIFTKKFMSLKEERKLQKLVLFSVFNQVCNN